MRISSLAVLMLLGFSSRLNAAGTVPDFGTPIVIELDGTTADAPVGVVVYGDVAHTQIWRLPHGNPFDYFMLRSTNENWAWSAERLDPALFASLDSSYRAYVTCTLTGFQPRTFYFPGVRSPITVEHVRVGPESLRGIEEIRAEPPPETLMRRWPVTELRVVTHGTTTSAPTWPAACSSPHSFAGDELRSSVSPACLEAFKKIGTYAVVDVGGKRLSARVSAVLPGIHAVVRAP